MSARFTYLTGPFPLAVPPEDREVRGVGVEASSFVSLKDPDWPKEEPLMTYRLDGTLEVKGDGGASGRRRAYGDDRKTAGNTRPQPKLPSFTRTRSR